MNEYDVIEIFKNLQRQGLINPNRQFVRASKLSFFNCCSFAARHPKNSKILEDFLAHFGIIDCFIEYDPRKIEFIDEDSLIFSLLHEECHMRYFTEKLDWDDSIIEKIPQTSLEIWKENEYKADKYAAKIILKNYPKINPYNCLRTVYASHQMCLKKFKNCQIKREIQKIFNSFTFGADDYHPTYEDRMENIRLFCIKTGYPENLEKKP